MCGYCLVDGNILQNAWTRAIKQTLYEQEIEDMNAINKIDNHLVRRLIVMPLTEAFNPNQASGMHGKVQYGDKCSLPTSIGRLIFEKPYEVPWLFEVRKISETKPDISDKINEASMEAPKVLDKVYISPLDFRSPENYIFMPQWLLKSLGLKANDLVEVSFVRIKLAGLVVFQPLTLDWDKLIEKHKNPKSLLEHEVNKYSSLTAGTTIMIEVDGIEYPLLVKDTKAEGGISVKGVRVQDSDINVDIDRSYLDSLIKEIKQKELEEESKIKAPEKEKKLKK